jgi:hypothetical protein
MGKVKLAHHNVTGEKVRVTLPLSFCQRSSTQERIFLPLASPLVSVLKNMSARSLSSSPNCPSWPMLFSQSDGVIHLSHVPSAVSSYSHRGHDQCDIHPTPFSCIFAAIRFLILLC